MTLRELAYPATENAQRCADGAHRMWASVPDHDLSWFAWPALALVVAFCALLLAASNKAVLRPLYNEALRRRSGLTPDPAHPEPEAERMQRIEEEREEERIAREDDELGRDLLKVQFSTIFGAAVVGGLAYGLAGFELAVLAVISWVGGTLARMILWAERASELSRARRERFQRRAREQRKREAREERAERRRHALEARAEETRWRDAGRHREAHEQARAKRDQRLAEIAELRLSQERGDG